MLRTRRLHGYRPLFSIVLIMFLWTVGSGVLWFLLPCIIEGFFSDVRVVGLVIALPNIIALLVDLPAGDMVDKVGRKRSLVFAFAMLMLLGLGFMYISSGLHAVMFLVGLGLVYQIVYISALAQVMDVSPRRDYSKFLGVEMSFIHLGFSLGPILAGVVISLFGFSMIATVSVTYALFCLLALLATMKLLKKEDNRLTFVESVKSVVLKDKLVIKELLNFGKLRGTGLVILFLTFIFTFFDGAVWLIQPLYYTKFSANPLYGGIIMAAFVIPLVLFEVPAGALADKIGRRNVLFVGLMTAGAFSILFSYSTSLITLVLTAFMATCGLAMAWPSSEGIISEKSSSSDRGGLIGVWSLAYDLGYVVGPLTAGLIAAYAGEKNVFVVLGGVVILSALMTLTIKEDKPHKPRL